MNEPRGPAGRGHFATTHWSLVLSAGGRATQESREALGALCQTYWFPLYAYARRSGHGVEQAQDLVQAFFLHVLEKQALRHADPARGRFRSFLLTSLKHFMANEHDRARAAKRGGDRQIETIDVSGAEGRYALEPRDDLNPETLFEHQWAVTLLDRVQARLRSTSTRSGKAHVFERLKDFMTGDETEISCREVGRTLGMSEGAVRVAIHRLRRSFRELLREEIAQTVADPAEIDDELRFMFATLATASGQQR